MPARRFPPVALHALAELAPDARDALLLRAEDDLERFLDGARPIIEAVRVEGDGALARFGREFDRAEGLAADAIRATPADVDAAFDALEPELIATMEYAADNIRRFHESQRVPSMRMEEIRPGVLVGERTSPIDSVACYSPRGKGSFPVVTLMTCIPATVAGVPERIALTPPGPDGRVDPATLVAARLSGVETVCKAGGAQAVAAAAFGTASVPRCAKIVGPGSPWLVAAKRLLAGRIDPGLPAGPSETILLADPSANPHVAALDLCIESEHGADSSAFLVTWDPELAERVALARAALLGADGGCARGLLVDGAVGHARRRRARPGRGLRLRLRQRLRPRALPGAVEDPVRAPRAHQERLRDPARRARGRIPGELPDGPELRAADLGRGAHALAAGRARTSCARARSAT